MIIHAGSSVCGGGGPTFDYLGTRTWIIWHHLPDLSNSLRSGRCHSGLSRVRARISRVGRATGRSRADGAECDCARHTGHAPRLGPADCLHAALTDACSVWARGGVRRQAAGVRFSEGQPRCSTKSMKIIFREGLGLSAYGRMTPAPQRSHTRSRKQHPHLHHVPPHWLQASSESEQTCIRCASDPCGL